MFSFLRVQLSVWLDKSTTNGKMWWILGVCLVLAHARHSQLMRYVPMIAMIDFAWKLYSSSSTKKTLRYSQLIFFPLRCIECTTAAATAQLLRVFFITFFFSYILHVPFFDVSDSGWFSLLLSIPRAFDACNNIIQLNAMQR